MAKARPALGNAVNEILRRHGSDGKRLSLRQAERLTGLSPATIGELAKGNARTPESVRRFALGLGEEADSLLILAGFAPEDGAETIRERVPSYAAASPAPEGTLSMEEVESLKRFGRALAQLPPGRARSLWGESLRRDAELIEACLDPIPSVDNA